MGQVKRQNETHTTEVAGDGSSGSETERTYEYDSKGRVTRCVFIQKDREDGRIISEGEVTYEYDGNGNRIAGRTHGTSTDDTGKTTEYDSTFHYAYTYVEDPDPWIAELARLADIPIPSSSAQFMF